MLKDFEYRNLRAKSLLSDVEATMRYLRGKDQQLIKDDDPEFFSFPVEGAGSVSQMSSSRRILKKFPSRKQKEVH